MIYSGSNTLAHPNRGTPSYKIVFLLTVTYALHQVNYGFAPIWTVRSGLPEAATLKLRIRVPSHVFLFPVVKI